MEIKITLDISDSFKQAVSALATSLLALSKTNAQERPLQPHTDAKPVETIEHTSETENAPETQASPKKRGRRKDVPAPVAQEEIEATLSTHTSEVMPQVTPVETDDTQESHQKPRTDAEADEPVNNTRAEEKAYSTEGIGATGAELQKLAMIALEETLGTPDAGERMRAYGRLCGIQYPAIPSLIQKVGIEKTIAICKGEL